jgi:Na+/H+ antiporter NhaD/arsenite permease-like protein
VTQYPRDATAFFSTAAAYWMLRLRGHDDPLMAAIHFVVSFFIAALIDDAASS